METVNNLRLDLDNQKRKLANSQENAERKAHYQEKVGRSRSVALAASRLAGGQPRARG